MRTNLVQVLISWMLVVSTPALALDATKYFAGNVYMYERSERFESILGGVVSYLRPPDQQDCSALPGTGSRHELPDAEDEVT